MLTRLASLALIAALFVGCGGGTSAPETLPGTFTGDGQGQTASFPLRGGDYVVDWTAANPNTTGVACYFAPAIKQSDGAGFADVAGVDVDTTTQATANLHGLGAGTWYFDVITGCSWTLLIHS